MLHQALEALGIPASGVRAFDGYLTLTHQVGKAAVHVYHAVSNAGFDDGLYLVRAFFADEVCNGAVVEQELVGRDKAARNARQ